MGQEDQGSRNIIEPPKSHPKARLGRSALKAAAGSVPGVGALAAEVVEAFCPDPDARDRRRWEDEITDGVNDLGDRVEAIDRQAGGGRQVVLEGGAAIAAQYMIRRCPDGLGRDHLTADDIHAAHPETSLEDLIDGLGELESYGLVESTSFIGAEDIFALTQRGYEALDPVVMGWDPGADARHVAALAVKQREGVIVEAVAEELGWPRRRFNPALQIVVDQIHPDSVSNECQPLYVTNCFYPSNAELFCLRRFAREKDDLR